MKTDILKTAGLATVLGFLATAAVAAEATLIFATTTPGRAPINTRVHHPWAKTINQAGKGVIKIDVRNGRTVANAINSYSRVMGNVVQISQASLSYVAGKFPLSDVVNLPLISGKSTPASVAFWRLYKSGLLNSEFTDVLPLALVALPQAGLHLSKKPGSLRDLKGLKLQSGGKILSQTLSSLGATPISLTVVNLYQALQRGTVDGTVIQYSTFPIFKFNEVTSYHVDYPFSSWPIMLFMQKKRFDGLSAEARRIVLDKSGEAQSRRWGQYNDAADQHSRRMIEAKAGRHTIVTPTPQRAEAWRKRIRPVLDKWAKSSPAAGKVLARYRAEIKKAEGKGG